MSQDHIRHRQPTLLEAKAISAPDGPISPSI
jgi:hypothetical protein